MNRKLFIFMLCMILPTSLFAAKDMFLLQDMCVRCHTLGENDGNYNSVISWRKSVHFLPDSGCADCHGGNKFLYMDFKKGHIGLPTKTGTIQMCGTCHPMETNDFINRPRGEPGEFNCTVTCVDCHGYHNVPAADASLINESHCGSCHPFEKAKYIQESISKAQSSFSDIQNRIELYERKHFPVESAKVRLGNIRSDFSRFFHSQPMKTIDTHIADNTMPALDEIKARMDEASPREWYIEGTTVLIFLIVLLVLILRYSALLTDVDK